MFKRVRASSFAKMFRWDGWGTFKLTGVTGKVSAGLRVRCLVQAFERLVPHGDDDLQVLM